jgi:heme O synthase-like polyprenyltransferase
VLQGLSMILILIFIFFAFNFIRAFMENRDKESRQIFIYSSTVFPTMKYI